MNRNTINEINEENAKPLPQKQDFDFRKLVIEVWASRKLILKVCAIGAIVGLIINFGTPKEYTANILITPESSSRRAPSSSVSALASMAGVNLGSASGVDAIYPSLYPDIVNSTPFLIGLFHLPVHTQKDNTVMTLAEYMKLHQKSPWWKSVTSAPSRMVNWAMSFFDDDSEANMEKKEIDSFRLTPEEAGMVGAMGSRIAITVEKKTLMITIAVTMQDPLIAATVADSVRTHLQGSVTEYRTGKARANLKYVEKLNKKAQAEYYKAQTEYARYADTNRDLVKQRSRAELERLQHDMSLAYAVYNQTNQQMSLAEAKVEEITPVYTIIQPALVPLTPSKPRKMLILAGCILLSGVGSVGWILFVEDFIRKAKKKRIAYRQIKTDD